LSDALRPRTFRAVRALTVVPLKGGPAGVVDVD
jgi:hypothetical protein